MRELRPFCINPLVAPLAFSHQLSKEVSEGCGDKEWRSTCLRRRYQNCLAKTQETRRWLIVSSSWSQRGHCSGWGSPRHQARPWGRASGAAAPGPQAVRAPCIRCRCSRKPCIRVVCFFWDLGNVRPPVYGAGVVVGLLGLGRSTKSAGGLISALLYERPRA
jgi:hypothetical protein